MRQGHDKHSKAHRWNTRVVYCCLGRDYAATVQMNAGEAGKDAGGCRCCKDSCTLEEARRDGILCEPLCARADAHLRLHLHHLHATQLFHTCSKKGRGSCCRSQLCDSRSRRLWELRPRHPAWRLAGRGQDWEGSHAARLRIAGTKALVTGC